MSKVKDFNAAWKDASTSQSSPSRDSLAKRPISPTSPIGVMRKAAQTPMPSSAVNYGDRIQTLLASECVPSQITDRLPYEADPSFEALKESIKNDGQKVPILVREHPTQTGKYEIAYGRRRWAACLSLGISVRAVVQALNDEQLVIAQGLENHERKNLTYIETALFVRKLSKGFTNEVVAKAIGASSKTTVSNYRSSIRALSNELIELIGPAPEVGRPSWTELSKSVENAQVGEEAAASELITMLQHEDCRGLDSNARFKACVQYFALPKGKTMEANNLKLEDKSGNPIAVLTVKDRELKVKLTTPNRAKIREYLASRIPELLKEI
ncbi:plasmid partitioning protein RepB [Polycladidibacter hongkongensis]|uniref:plasmid partitioning protein RepB n=1 Tax=Polycladidibacter hongkongensis TaxID=1647556 RepID=UPI00082B86A5|nr:plasmid partitioning protein RepB [Pseudovibrio hongkongensis]